MQIRDVTKFKFDNVQT